MIRHSVGKIATRRGAAIGTTTVALGSTVAYVSFSDDVSARGFRRQSQFWSRIVPVIADYYWNFAKSSPLVRYQTWRRQQPLTTSSDHPNRDVDLDDGAALESKDDPLEAEFKRRRDEKIHAMHRKHAPAVLEAMLDLKGLYIKLGQVLSVSVLPVPEEYRELFRSLQSDVPGWEEFDFVVRPVLEHEFGVDSLDEIFSHVDSTPCGAASIGQAHHAVLKEGGDEVIVKMQYPNAVWQVPADIQCVGDFLQICVWTGVVDESASKLSFDEFSRQFLAELEYKSESRNLKEIYESSLDPSSPYQKWGVVVPKVYENLCTEKVITMTYIPGPKLEQEARRQMEAIGIDTTKGMNNLVQMDLSPADPANPEETVPATKIVKQSWKASVSRRIGEVVGLDRALWLVRLARRLLLWSKSVAVTAINVVPLMPHSWEEWAAANQAISQQVKQLVLTETWIEALFDCHGHQIFELGLFNADPHPGNILVIDEGDGKPANRLGLIDFGQCKRLTHNEQVRIADLILSVANNDPDEKIAAAFRNLGITTENDSTEFLASFANLLFGPLKPHHLDHDWHNKLHKMDYVTYFPKDLSMVYRTALLLRGLAISLQVNSSVSALWRKHAQAAIDLHGCPVNVKKEALPAQNSVHEGDAKGADEESFTQHHSSIHTGEAPTLPVVSTTRSTIG